MISRDVQNRFLYFDSVSLRFWKKLGFGSEWVCFSLKTLICDLCLKTLRHWSVSLWRDPDDVSHCWILSPDKTEWRLISATLCRWRRCLVADQSWFMKRIREVFGSVLKRQCLKRSWVQVKFILSLLIRIADCTQLLSENHPNGCQIFGQLVFLSRIRTDFQCSTHPYRSAVWLWCSLYSAVSDSFVNYQHLLQTAFHVVWNLCTLCVILINLFCLVVGLFVYRRIISGSFQPVYIIYVPRLIC